MTKTEVVAEISERTGLSKKEALAVIESFMDVVKESLIVKKEMVSLRGFGNFTIKHRAPKTARNIQKNTTVYIPAHDLPCFKPAKEFIEKMKQ